MASSADRQQAWDPDAVPGLAPPPAVLSEQVLVVDGERFLVSEHTRRAGTTSTATTESPASTPATASAPLARSKVRESTSPLSDPFWPTSTPTPAT
jgi:hypothetical protein